MVDEICDKQAAAKMGIERVGQVVVMIHSGSRVSAIQVATDALVEMERAMKRDKFDSMQAAGLRKDYQYRGQELSCCHGVCRKLCLCQ